MPAHSQVGDVEVSAGSLTHKGLRLLLLSGALQGALGWIGFSVLESALLCLLPWLASSPVSRPIDFVWPVHAMYALWGATLGATSAACLAFAARAWNRPGWQLDHWLRSLVLCTMPGAFALHLCLHYREHESLYVALAGCALLAGIALAAAVSHIWRLRLSPIANQWSLSLLLLAWSGLLFQARNSGVSMELVIALAFAALLGIYACAFWMLRDRSDGSKHILSGRRGRIAEIAGLLAGGLLIPFLPHPSEKPLEHTVGGSARLGSHPNVILISLDTVRADHLSVYGYPYPTTPELEAFAEGASIYTRAVATAPWTLPSHASMFTGLYPRAHGSHYDPPDYPLARPLSESFQTLAEHLSDEGYATGAVIANFGPLGRSYGLDQGFQLYDDRPFAERTRVAGWPGEAVANLLKKRFPDATYYRRTRTAEQINRVASTALDLFSQDGSPFLLFLNYMDAHWPYLPPPPHDTLVEGRIPTFTTHDFWRIQSSVLGMKTEIDPQERQHLISQYDGGIAYLDQQLGHLFKELRERRLYDESLIIITSDHGEAFGPRNLIAHAVSVYQPEVHIPLLVKFPNSTEARVIEDLVSQVDLLPTVLEIVGITSDSSMAGVSLLSDPIPSDRFVISEVYHGPWLSRIHSRFRRIERAIFAGDSKLIRSDSGKLEFFELASDPSESIDRSGDLEERSRVFETMLDRWLESTPPLPNEPDERTRDLDDETRRRLKALGYLD